MSKLKHPLFELLRSDAHISVNKALMFALGNDEALIYAELLSRHVYFESRELLEDGYFYNTIEDLFSGTNLSVYKQRAAINNLKLVGLVDMAVKGLPPKRFFKIENSPELLSELIEIGREKGRKARRDANKRETHKFNSEKLATNKNINNCEPLSDETQAHMNDLAALTAMGELLKANHKRMRH
jgi:hypothetical protein